MRCAPVHIEVAIWRARLELEHPLLGVLLHQGEDLHKEDGGRLWKKMVVDEYHVENALLSCIILHEGEDLHKDDGDAGGDAHGHNFPLFEIFIRQGDWMKHILTAVLQTGMEMLKFEALYDPLTTRSVMRPAAWNW